MKDLITDHLNIYCDGGSRGNPGPAAGAFVVFDSSNAQVFSLGNYLGVSTNNQAEYSGVLSAMKWIKDHHLSLQSVKKINFYLDSLLVVNQLNGLYRVKDQKIKEIYQEVTVLKNNLAIIDMFFYYIPRSSNSVADLLVNQTLDSYT